MQEYFLLDMNVVIVGAGSIGLSLAIAMVRDKKINPKKILIIDRFNIPSKGTSVTNSGVIHAGLYYKKKL